MTTGQINYSPETPAPEHVIEFIYEEMEARGWDEWELARRMGGDPAHNKLSLEILDACRDVHVLLGEDSAEQMSRAFGTGAEIWLNLDKTWRDHKRAELERAGLERKVIEALKACRGQPGTSWEWLQPSGAYGPEVCNAWETLSASVDALLEFESQQK